MVSQIPKRQRYPVDPAKYPLSGPSSGPVYVPIEEAEREMKKRMMLSLYADTRPPTPLWVKLFWWTIAAAGFYAIFIGAIEIGSWVGDVTVRVLNP